MSDDSGSVLVLLGGEKWAGTFARDRGNSIDLDGIDIGDRRPIALAPGNAAP